MASCNNAFVKTEQRMIFSPFALKHWADQGKDKGNNYKASLRDKGNLL